MSTEFRAGEMPGLERRDKLALKFFIGTDVEWHDLIDHLEADPTSSPAAFLAEYPAVSLEQLLVVLRGMAAAMASTDAWKALKIALDHGKPGREFVEADALDYLYERLARRAVVEAWRDQLIAAEQTPEAER